MGKKEAKTNAMRILEQKKLPHKNLTYECAGFLDGITVAKKLGQPLEKTYKTLVSLGKSGQYADLQLPSSAVSRLHARLVWNGETYELGDLNSRNGTWVNETLLGAEQMEPLQDGDKIRFADLTYLYRK